MEGENMNLGYCLQSVGCQLNMRYPSYSICQNSRKFQSSQTEQICFHWAQKKKVIIKNMHVASKTTSDDMLCIKINCNKCTIPKTVTLCDKVLAKLSLTLGTGSVRRYNKLGKNSWENCSPVSTFSSSKFWQSCAYLWNKDNVLS